MECGLAFVDAELRKRVPAHFAHILETLEVDGTKDARAQLRLDTAAIGDWWLCRVSGRGPIRFGGPPPIRGLGDRALLTQCLSGLCRSFGASSLVAPPSQMALAKWGQFDEVACEGDIHFHCAYVPQTWLADIAAEVVPYDRSISTVNGGGAVVTALMNSMLEQALAGHDRATLERMLPEFMRLALAAIGGQAPRCGQSDDPMERRIRKLLNYMRVHFADPNLNPARAARECGVSERQLYRDFASQGDSFAAALRRMRLAQAAARLSMDAQASVTDVAFDCGFAAPAHFARSFRTAYGVAPSGYRASRHMKSPF